MPGETLLDREAAIQCQQFRQEEAATAVYNEATLLVKSYRACLEKYEQMPVRAREYCAMYGKALQDIGLQIKEPVDAGLTEKDAARTPSKSKF
jgi:methylaspartate ammonia-lyase